MNDRAVAAPAAEGPTSTTVGAGRACLGCGYDLGGLPSDGACPECGAPVARSLKGPLLRFASGELLAKLHTGVVLVIAGTIAQLALTGVAFVAGIAAAISGSAPFIRSAQVLSAIGSTVLTVAILIGWWLVTTPDPGVAPRWDARRTRRWVRITVIIQIGASLLQMFSTLATPALQTGGMAVWIVGIGVALVAIGAWIAAFFAQMLYLRWIARRIPDPRVVEWTKMMMWLGPLLYTVGMLALFLGPLAAMILYLIMLNWVRKDLKRIRRSRDDGFSPERLPA